MMLATVNAPTNQQAVAVLANKQPAQKVIMLAIAQRHPLVGSQAALGSLEGLPVYDCWYGDLDPFMLGAKPQARVLPLRLRVASMLLRRAPLVLVLVPGARVGGIGQDVLHGAGVPELRATLGCHARLI